MFKDSILRPAACMHAGKHEQINDSPCNDCHFQQAGVSGGTENCGWLHGAALVEKGATGSLKGLKKTLFTKPAQWVFEMKILECTDDRFSIDFHYCPLVKAWQKQNCSDDDISRLCETAMCGDRGIAESYGCVMDLPKAIARGDDVCEIRFRRPEGVNL